MYKKQCFVFHQNKPVTCTVRSYTSNDFDELIRIQEESFPPPFPSELLWSKDQLNNHVSLFTDGALCVEIERTYADLSQARLFQWKEMRLTHGMK